MCCLKWTLAVLLLFLHSTSTAYSHKILVLLPFSSVSHKNVISPLVNELAKRGHQVTMFSSTDPKKNQPNVKEVKIDGFPKFMTTMQEGLFERAQKEVSMDLSVVVPVISEVCKNFLIHPATEALLRGKRQQFDLAIVSQFFNDCALSAGVLLAKHVILISPAGQLPWMPTSAPTPPSYVQLFTLGNLGPTMTFWERVTNVYSIIALKSVKKFLIDPATNAIIRQYLPPDAPSVDEALDQVCLIILNADPVIHSPRPGFPNVVEVGGMHLRTANPLPPDFLEFVESSGPEGVIMFGLGSNAQSKNLPVEIRDAFIDAFRRLKQKVIWKFEDENIPNLPPNVKITDWMPQQDLLANPNVKLFITHGGLLSLEEALYHGVPVIGLPLFADQPSNVNRVKQLGIGEGLELNNITADNIYNKITKVLGDPSYEENTRKYSSVLRDQLTKPLDKAVFWVEYVIRHDGAPHLRSPGDSLNFFQYFLLDVAAAVISAAVIIVVVVVVAVKKLVCFTRCPKSQKNKQQ